MGARDYGRLVRPKERKVRSVEEKETYENSGVIIPAGHKRLKYTIIVHGGTYHGANEFSNNKAAEKALRQIRASRHDWFKFKKNW